MKKIITSFVIILISSTVWAQTNIFPANGNVGIGTTSPVAPLDVHLAPAPGTPIVVFNYTFSNYSSDPDLNRPFVIRRSGSNSEALFTFIQDEATHFVYRNDEWSSRIFFKMVNTDTETGEGENANASDVMVLHGNNTGGGLTIGTSILPAGVRLAVNGSIQASEIKVKTGWADYVFEDDYNLLPLDELETYVASEKHLPGIPDAEEVEKEGIEVGQMNAKLMEKVEELTLYLIDLNKKFERQEKVINQLVEKNSNLELELKQLKK